MAEVDVYLSFADAVTDHKRHEFLRQLEACLSSSMEMGQQNGEPCVHFECADPTAAVAAVQLRAQQVMQKLCLDDRQVTWSLRPSD
jgi:hypothetical protein